MFHISFLCRQNRLLFLSHCVQNGKSLIAPTNKRLALMTPIIEGYQRVEPLGFIEANLALNASFARCLQIPQSADTLKKEMNIDPCIFIVTGEFLNVRNSRLHHYWWGRNGRQHRLSPRKAKWGTSCTLRTAG